MSITEAMLGITYPRSMVYSPSMDEYVFWRGFKVLADNIPQKLPGGYVFRNLVNGKQYYGITGAKEGIVGRCWNSARGHGATRLDSAIKKYGSESFLLTPIVYVVGEIDREWLSRSEAEWIKDNDAIANGYNIQAASGAVGPYGEKFGDILREAWARPGARQRRSAILKEFSNRPEVKLNSVARLTAAYQKSAASRAEKGEKLAWWHSPFGAEYLAVSKRDISDEPGRSPGFSEVNRAAQIGHKTTESARLSMSKASKGKPKSKAHAAKISQGILRFIAANPGGLSLHNFAGTRHWHTPEGVNYRAYEKRSPNDLLGMVPRNKKNGR
jgi:hypothetical protein